MAHIDPKFAQVLPSRPASTAPRFELKIHEIAPEDIEPNGDRYVVEVIDIDEKIELGRILVVTQDVKRDPRDPQADPRIEERGVIAAIVVRAGNGHLLGLADHAVVLGEPPLQSVARPKASVPMFYSEGDVVLIDHNARGRAVKILGRECRIVNQIDCLARIPKLKLKRGEDGGWEQENDGT